MSLTSNDDGTVHVSENVVATPLPDGYWLEAFPFSDDATLPDLIGYGLGLRGNPAAIKLFQNPRNTGSSGWKVIDIQHMDFPVGMTYADLTGDGFNDIIICDRYGPTMNDLWDATTENGGRVQWLRNPGSGEPGPYWEARHIGNSTGMHRLQAGHFTSHDITQILALPIIAASGDLTSAAPVILYTPVYGECPGKGPESWVTAILFQSQFRLIHDVKLLKGMNEGLDMVLVAGREGTVLLWAERTTGQWQYNVIGTGLPQEGNNPYWGSGSVDIARVGDDDAGYIVTCEGFHGNIVSVYLKDNQTSPKGGESLKDSSLWRRVVIDNFGPVDPVHFTGTIHHVATIRDSKSDIESFAIACIGAPLEKPENQGIYVYTPVNLSRGSFKKAKVSQESAGRLAIAGFTNPNHIDIASISYYVPGYHVGSDPSSIRINTLGQDNSSTINVTKLGKEVLLRIPRPSLIPNGQLLSMPMVAIAGRRISLMVLPPLVTAALGPEGGVKVIYGSITFPDGTTRGIAPIAKTATTTEFPFPDGTVTANQEGAVVLRVEPIPGESQGPYSKMSDITAQNIFPQTPAIPADVRVMTFPFVKVENLPWAGNDFDHFEFYNMTGFYVYFNDDAMEEIVHIQAWTLGLGETARFHKHDTKSFCEIHYCLSNGAGTGGMRYFRDDDNEEVDKELELTKEYIESRSTLLVVPDMHEHGPLWKIQQGSIARPQLNPNATADYPWHAWLSSRVGDFLLPIVPPLPEEQQRYDLWLAFEFPTSLFQY